jgi:hypothetical protein
MAILEFSLRALLSSGEGNNLTYYRSSMFLENINIPHDIGLEVYSEAKLEHVRQDKGFIIGGWNPPKS